MDGKVKDMRLPGGKGLLMTLYGKGDRHEVDIRAHIGSDEVTHVQGSFSVDVHPYSPEPGKPMPEWMQATMAITMNLLSQLAQGMTQQPPGATSEQPQPEPKQSEGDGECQPSGT